MPSGIQKAGRKACFFCVVKGIKFGEKRMGELTNGLLINIRGRGAINRRDGQFARVKVTLFTIGKSRKCHG